MCTQISPLQYVTVVIWSKRKMAATAIPRLRLPAFTLSFSQAGRTGRTYNYRACLFSGLNRNVSSHHTPGEGDEDLIPLTEPYSTKHVHGADGLKDSHHTFLTSGQFDSTQGSIQFDDGADTLLEDLPSSRRDKMKTTIKKKAYQALAARSLTALQLRRKLIEKHFPADMVEAIIIDLQSSGIQSDSDYAELFSRSRWLSLSWGPKKIKSALMHRGVSRTDAERALQHIFNDTDKMDEEKKWGMSDSARAHLMAQATKKWLQGENVSFQTRKTRMVWWLQYRGFNWDVINPVLKELQANYPLQQNKEDFSDLS